MQTTGQGVFVPRRTTRLDDIADGLSNTVMIGEIATDLSDKDIRTAVSMNNGWRNPGVLDDPSICQTSIDPMRPRFWLATSGPVLSGNGNTVAGRGYVYSDFSPLMSGINTILPPNRELCFGGDWLSVGTAPPSSRHPGGCHVGMADGAIHFITDSIECGDLNAPSVILGGKPGQAAAIDEIDADWASQSSVPSESHDRQRGIESPYGLWGAMGTRNGNELIEGYW